MITSDVIFELAITISISGSLFALTAVGFTLFYRVTKILHCAHGVVVLASGYALWWAMERGASFFFAVVFACAVALALGWCMHMFVYRYFYTRRKVLMTTSLIASLTLLFLGQNVLLLLFGAEAKSLITTEAWLSFSSPEILATTTRIVTIGVSFACVIATMIFLRRSRLGKGMRAVGDNPIAAEIAGIAVTRMRLVAMLIASFLGGVAGILYALLFPLVPTMATTIAVRSFAGAIIGGVGSLLGAFTGSFIVEAVESVGVFFFTVGLKSVFSFGIIFLFLFIRPRGMFGEKSRKEDL